MRGDRWSLIAGRKIILSDRLAHAFSSANVAARPQKNLRRVSALCGWPIPPGSRRGPDREQLPGRALTIERSSDHSMPQTAAGHDDQHSGHRRQYRRRLSRMTGGLPDCTRHRSARSPWAWPPALATRPTASCAASFNLRSRQTCERTSLCHRGLKCTPSCRVRRSRRRRCLIARRDARQR
jgi:hypothetical protein